MKIGLRKCVDLSVSLPCSQNVGTKLLTGKVSMMTVSMMLVDVVREEIVNVCVQPSLTLLLHVTRPDHQYTGEEMLFVVS